MIVHIVQAQDKRTLEWKEMGRTYNEQKVPDIVQRIERGGLRARVISREEKPYKPLIYRGS